MKLPVSYKILSTLCLIKSNMAAAGICVFEKLASFSVILAALYSKYFFLYENKDRDKQLFCYA
jgi:hypothetical protein